MDTPAVTLGDYLDPATGIVTLPDHSIDHVITDPPYCAHVHGKRNATRHLNGYDVPAIEFPPFVEADAARFALEAARVARRWVVVFCSDRQLGNWIAALECAGLRYVRTGVWVKHDPMPQMTGDRPAQGFELIAVAHVRSPGRMRWNGGGRPLTYHGSRGEAPGILRKRAHPTEKPAWLMEALIRDFTDRGEVVADPFAGSGSTGVAARRLGRRFVGWERDPRFAAVASERVAATLEQTEFCLPLAVPRARQMSLIGK